MKKSKRINVVIMRFGSDPEKIEVPEGSTVTEALDEAGITLNSNEKVWIDGERATKKDVVEEGDNIAIVSPKEAGIK